MSGCTYPGHGRHKWQKHQQLHLAVCLVLNAEPYSRPSMSTGFTSKEESPTAGGKYLVRGAKPRRFQKEKLEFAMHMPYIALNPCAWSDMQAHPTVTCVQILVMCNFIFTPFYIRDWSIHGFWYIQEPWNQSHRVPSDDCTLLGPVLRERSRKFYYCCFFHYSYWYSSWTHFSLRSSWCLQMCFCPWK